MGERREPLISSLETLCSVRTSLLHTWWRKLQATTPIVRLGDRTPGTLTTAAVTADVGSSRPVVIVWAL